MIAFTMQPFLSARILTKYMMKSKFVNVPIKHVILNSGGPLLNLETVEGDNAIVSWDDDGQLQRRMFPVACLSLLVPMVS